MFKQVTTLVGVVLTVLTPTLSVAADGDLDLTFGVGGKVTTDFLGPGADFGLDVIAVQPDGKIVVVGVTSGAGIEDFATRE